GGGRAPARGAGTGLGRRPPGAGVGGGGGPVERTGEEVRVPPPNEERCRREWPAIAPNPEGRAAMGRRAASLVVESRTRLISSSLLGTVRSMVRRPIAARRERGEFSNRA